MTTLEDFAARLDLTENGERDFAATAELPEDLSVFAGHFPGNPILPGVVYIFIAERLIDRFSGERFTLKQLKRSKFYQPSLPGRVMKIDGHLERNAAEPRSVVAGVVFSDGDGRKICSLKMILEK